MFGGRDCSAFSGNRKSDGNLYAMRIVLGGMTDVCFSAEQAIKAIEDYLRKDDET